MSKKYDIPSFLQGAISQEVYERWLRRKAQAHVKRDRNRGNSTAIGGTYRIAIHAAVLECNGVDAYTGQQLDWGLLSKYDNESSEEQGRAYKHQFAKLPTVDHIGDGKGIPEFKICSWRTNDAKHDLSMPEFTKLCIEVLKHQGFSVTEPLSLTDSLLEPSNSLMWP